MSSRQLQLPVPKRQRRDLDESWSQLGVAAQGIGSFQKKRSIEHPWERATPAALRRGFQQRGGAATEGGKGSKTSDLRTCKRSSGCVVPWGDYRCLMISPY
jgi:hypothetical protein